ncbi:fumarylacetoacetate hydrolase family protein [Rubrivivax sp. A210]|uniref:fumarylacetoacetate hydrolase family protein n=1 Tax=Rubrivivax sp. A210 TaxID=2772301 RepID=UPI0019186B23|nr:fumarylacetoacetate hydrolase family protein [Rubrivivax sp. A210]
MKLATLKDGSRDGQLAVVSRDLASAHHATGIAGTLQQALDDWNFVAPQLEDLYATLNGGKARHAFAFEPRLCMAPLPRAHQWLDASAYPSHIERIRRARGAEPPDDLRSLPLVYQGGSDDFLGPCDDAVFANSDDGIDLEAEIAVVTGDLPMGASPDYALEGVRLLLLANDWSLRALAPAEVARGFGLLQAKPATAFAPVAVTPDELGPAWQGGRARLTVECLRNGQRLGRLEAAPGMHFHFGQILAHAARTRRLRAGCIVGGGAISSEDPAQGVACLAELRALEIAAGGAATTPFLQFGETVRIEAIAPDGSSVFGAIEQAVAELERDAA